MNLVTVLGGITQALKDADPADKAEIYRRIGLTLTYRPQGGLHQKSLSGAPLLTGEFAIAALADAG